MNPFLLYIVKAALSISGLYVVYLLFLGRDTMYKRNRCFILLSVFASLIFPLIVIETRQPIDIQFFEKNLTGIIVENNPDMLINPGEIRSSHWIYSLVPDIYFAGLIFFSIRTLAELMSLLYLILRQKNRDNNIIWLKNHRTAGFSAFGYIFIDARLNSDVANDIIRHEQKHLGNFHFLDILLIESLKAIQWFNPFVYLIDKSLREVHEFQADEECLNSGITIRRYQGLLLNQVFTTNIFSTSDGFSNPTIIKKRIIMMTRKRSGSLANLKMLAAMPVIIFLLISFSTTTPVEIISDYAYPAVISDTYASLLPPPVSDSLSTTSVTVTGTNDSMEKRHNPITTDGEMPVYRPANQEEATQTAEYAAGTPTVSKVYKEIPPPPPPLLTSSLSAGKEDEFIVFQQNYDIISLNNTPVIFAEKMPEYPGGDAALIKYISRNTRYPGEAVASGKEGRVVVRFCVTETGNVDLVSILKGVDPALDAEAIRVVSKLSGFAPAMQGGKPVPVWYSVPITFTII